MRTQVASMAVVVLVLLGSLGVAAQDVATSSEIENLSDGRGLGLGIQVEFPWGGLISGRYWLSPDLGLEGVLFLWGDAGDLGGRVTARGLFRVADASAVDFYVAGGATIGFTPYRVEPPLLSAVGGIEFGFRHARNLAWNIEFGISVSTAGALHMAFGTGVHFYFDRPTP